MRSVVAGIRLRIPNVTIEAAAQQNAVAAREHVDIAGADRAVVHFGLRQQENQLAADRNQFGVAEQRARAKTRAVENQLFAQRQ